MATSLAKRIASAVGIDRKAHDARIARAGAVELDGIELPPAKIRLGGHNFANDRDFLNSAKRDAERLQTDLAVTSSSRILDIGCGVGRLPIGLRAHFGAMPHYTGLDVDAGVIAWCQKHITDSNAHFIHLDLANERYNPRGAKIGTEFRLPFDDGSLDAIYLYSVFSHMVMDDVSPYLREFRRLLAPSGAVFLTAFVEADVEDVAINPAGYGTLQGEWSGALHCVRFSREFFENNVTRAGLRIARFDHASDTDGQSAIYLKRLVQEFEAARQGANEDDCRRGSQCHQRG